MRCLRVLLVAIVPVSVAAAGSPEWEKSVRAAAAFPTGKIVFGVGINDHGEFSIQGEVAKPKPGEPTLADLTAQWREVPADFLKVEAIVCGLTNEQPEKAAEYAAKGAALGPAYLRAHPDDFAAMLLLGELLDRTGKHADAEAWLTQATKTAPKEPRAWRGLALHHFNHALRVVLGAGTPRFDDPMMFLLRAHPQARRALRDHLLWAHVNGKHAASGLLAQASDCYDWAVLLAPDAVAARVFRCHWQQTLRMLQLVDGPAAQDSHMLGNIYAMRGVVRENTTVEDSLRAAELSPDPRGVGYAILAMIMGPQDESDRPPEVKAEAMLAKFRPFLPKLDRLRESPDGATAQNAARMQILLLGMLLDEAKAAEKLLRAMPADPDDVVQDHLAMLVYAELDDTAGMVKLMQKKLAAKPDAHRSFLLAKSLIRAKQYAEAKTHLREAVKQHPADARLAITLAATLIGHGAKDDMLEADRVLTTAEAVFDTRLTDVAKRSTWDETVPGLPPIKDRGLGCVHCLPADDQELLQMLRTNRVLWLGLAGRNTDAFYALQKWGVMSRPGDTVVMDAFHLIDPGRGVAAGHVIPSPGSSLLSTDAFPLPATSLFQPPIDTQAPHPSSEPTTMERLSNTRRR